MDVRVKLFIDSNPNYKRYLRTNSYWYKTLIRNSEMIDAFASEVKEKYRLRTSDKISDIIDKINMVSKFINVLRWWKNDWESI